MTSWNVYSFLWNNQCRYCLGRHLLTTLITRWDTSGLQSELNKLLTEILINTSSEIFSEFWILPVLAFWKTLDTAGAIRWSLLVTKDFSVRPLDQTLGCTIHRPNISIGRYLPCLPCNWQKRWHSMVVANIYLLCCINFYSGMTRLTLESQVHCC